MTHTERATAIAVNAWKSVLERLNDIVQSVSDEDLEVTVAPNRNRVSYVLGHLVAVHDRMLPLLGLGDRLHAEYDAPFLTSPDTHEVGSISAADLRAAWTEVNSALTAKIEALPSDAWFEKHTSVSDEDFEKDPLRNRLAVLLSRTNHASFHQGQLRLTR
jgi:hypothetical protein